MVVTYTSSNAYVFDLEKGHTIVTLECKTSGRQKSSFHHYGGGGGGGSALMQFQLGLLLCHPEVRRAR